MDYGALFQRLYDRQPVGFEEGVLAREEDRLAFVLPPPLRSLYLACGREECVMGSHNRFLAPAALDVADGRLVFCGENQGVCVWGCVPGDEDPAAEVGNVLRDGALEWHSEEMSLRRFLEIMVYLQTAWGGFEHVAGLCGAERVMSNIEAEWDEVVRHNGLTIYEKPGLLITLLDGDGFVTAAARTPERLSWIERELGFEQM